MSASSSPRRVCRGEGFDHEPAHMSIARVLADDVRLRCPLCLAEATV